MKKIKYTLFFLLATIFSHSQVNNFYSPLDIPLHVTGSFGELRTNSFHAGVDFRTNGVTGLPVFCVDDGYVSRIGVSAAGYGHVVYVDHLNGMTSVYAHLDSFEPVLSQWVKEQQYSLESFEVNLFPEANQFMFKRGQLIAKSGNTGSSGGPHLHFELRVSDGQYPVNPFLYNFDVKDNRPPYVENLFVYPLTDGSHVVNKTERQRFKLVFYDGAYRLQGRQAIDVYGETGFGVDAIDYFDNNWSRCGIYKLEYRVNNQLIHSFTFDTLDYSTMRYHNSHIDFAALRQDRVHVHRLFTDPGNKLGIYTHSENRGVFYFESGKRYNVEIILYDTYMNRSKIEFIVNATRPVKHTSHEYAAIFNHERENRYADSEFEIIIPKDALYDNLKFIYKRDKMLDGTYSSLHRVHNRLAPLHVAAQISIDAIGLPENLNNKALIAMYNEASSSFSYIGGVYNDGRITATTREFGSMCIVVDTIPPAVRSLNLRNGRLTEPGKIRFRITDNLSGIRSYRGEIDGQWVLFEYDAKNNMLEYKIDNRIKRGNEYTLTLEVSDRVGNTTVVKEKFIY